MSFLSNIFGINQKTEIKISYKTRTKFKNESFYISELKNFDNIIDMLEDNLLMLIEKKHYNHLIIGV